MQLLFMVFTIGCCKLDGFSCKRVTMKLQIQLQSIGNFDGGAAMPIQSPKTHQNQTVFALFASSLKNQGAQKRTRKPLSLKSSSLSSSSSASLQRSIFVQSDDEERNTPVISKKISTRSSSKSHATVGVLGGASVITTLRFLEKLVYWSTKHGEGKDVSVSHEESIPFIVCSDPCFSYSNGGQDLDPLIIENLRKKRVFLEEGGAGCIVMPCHVSHIWYDEISDDCPFPFLNVAECVALELKEAKLKPIEAGSNVRIGVIATDAVLMGRFYQEKLNKQDFEVVLPDKASMERIVLPAINALKRKDMEGAQNLLRIAIQMLLVRAVNVVILACDELQSLLPTDDPLLKQCLDPIDVLARSTVRYAKSAKRLEDNS